MDKYIDLLREIENQLKRKTAQREPISAELESVERVLRVAESKIETAEKAS